MDKKVTSVNETVSKLTSYDDVCFIQLYDEQLDTFKVELDDIYQSVLNSGELEDEELSIQQTELARSSLIVNSKKVAREQFSYTYINPNR